MHEPLLTLGVPTPLFLAVAIILEARRNIGIVTLWPKELDYMIFGCEIPVSDNQSDPRNMIFRVLEQVQLQLYGSKKQESSRESPVVEKIEIKA